MDSSRTKFRELVDAFGNISELARRSGLSRRAIQYKCEGDRRVTQWDVWAVERTLQLHVGESKGEPAEESAST
jgi:DNA-binding phage protein